MSDGELRMLNVGNQRIAVKGFNEDQQNTPIVFIHGITSSINFWVRGQTPSLASQRWYSLSLPGHYPSEFPAGFKSHDLTPELIADVTADAIRQLVGNQSVILAGHSTGGFTALAVAARHPEQVKAVASISGFAHGYWTGALRLLQIQARLGGIGQLLFKFNMKVLTSSYRLYRASLRAYAADWKALYDNPYLDPTLEVIYPDAARLSHDAMIAFFNRMPDIDITGWLPRIKAPALALAGDRDMIVPPQQARVIAKNVPCSTLHMIKGVGHLPMSESGHEYHQIVGGWIQQYL